MSHGDVNIQANGGRITIHATPTQRVATISYANIARFVQESNGGRVRKDYR